MTNTANILVDDFLFLYLDGKWSTKYKGVILTSLFENFYDV